MLSCFLAHPVVCQTLLNCGASVTLQGSYLHCFKLIKNKEAVLLSRTNRPPGIYKHNVKDNATKNSKAFI